jgi:hypothetical protein
MENIESKPIFVSLGYRCSSAALLKKLQLKNESYPFDWLVSRLSVIEDSIQSDFKEFLNINNYERRYSNTYKTMDSEEGFICDEHLMVNTYYQPQDNPHPNNTYQYQMAMNHHNILLKDDYEYYQRCVQRFTNLQESINPIIFVNIQHVISFADFEKSREHILECIQNFDNFLYTTYCGTHTHTHTPTPRITGLYFIMVQDSPHPEEPHQIHSNEKIQYECMKNTNSRIHLVFVNRDFIDAGETFMGNCQYEREYIENIILGYVE